MRVGTGLVRLDALRAKEIGGIVAPIGAILRWSFLASLQDNHHKGLGQTQQLWLLPAMSAASAAAAPAPVTMPTTVVPPAGEAAALPALALPTPQELDHVAAFYNKFLAAYSARSQQGSSGRSAACDTHRTYAIADLAARCAVRAARARERGNRRK